MVAHLGAGLAVLEDRQRDPGDGLGLALAALQVEQGHGDVGALDDGVVRRWGSARGWSRGGRGLGDRRSRGEEDEHPHHHCEKGCESQSHACTPVGLQGGSACRSSDYSHMTASSARSVNRIR
ncbi:MAG: hypothetical protein ABW004_11700 [Aeromicrobium sp.]